MKYFGPGTRTGGFDRFARTICAARHAVGRYDATRRRFEVEGIDANVRSNDANVVANGSPTSALPTPMLQIVEGLLLPGARVLVCGVAVRELAATDYRDGAHALVMRATSTFPLVASSDADLFKETNRPIAPEELRTRR